MRHGDSIAELYILDFIIEWCQRLSCCLLFCKVFVLHIPLLSYQLFICFTKADLLCFLLVFLSRFAL